jgi:hypothetical protein
MSNELFGFPANKPNRSNDPERRPAPRAPDLAPAEPWFVAPEKEQKNSRYSSKNITKRLVSILFPLAGIIFIGLMVAGAIMYTLGMYK